MKAEKVKKLFDKHTVELTYSDNTMRVMSLEDFTQAVNQAELAWYKELESKLNRLKCIDNYASTLIGISEYQNEIQSGIKELENVK